MKPWQPLSFSYAESGEKVPIPSPQGEDKSDSKLKMFYQNTEAHLIVSDELFCFMQLCI